MEKVSQTPMEVAAPHQEVAHAVLSAERLDAVARLLPGDYGIMFDKVVRGVDDARTRSADQAAEFGASEMFSARRRAMDEVSGLGATESLSRTALEIKIHSRLLDVPTRNAIDAVAERHGIETKPYTATDLINDIQTGRLDSRSEAYARLQRGSQNEATYRLIAQKTGAFVDDYKSRVAQKAAEGVVTQVDGEAAGVGLHEVRTEEFRAIGTETFDNMFAEKLAMLESVASARVARGIGKSLLRNLGIDKPRDDGTLSSKEAKESALYHAMTDLEQLIDKGPKLYHAVREKVDELGIKDDVKNNIQDTFNHAMEYAVNECSPDKLDALLNDFFARQIIPELKARGYKFVNKEKQHQAGQNETQTGNNALYEAAAVGDVEADIREMQSQGLSEPDIRRRLLLKYHPDVSKDPNAEEKIRYFNNREI